MPLPSRQLLLQKYLDQLVWLFRELPERFRPRLEHLIVGLPRLFSEDWPLVINHHDLLKNIDLETGKIAGICD